MARKLFGSLDFSRMVAPGENPNGYVAHTPNGTSYGSTEADGDQYVFSQTEPRWNHKPKMQDLDVARPVAIAVARRR